MENFNKISKIVQNSKYYEISHDIAKAITRESSPEGIIFEIDIPKQTPAPISLNDRVLLLYKISDPGNLGTLIRSARALDWNHVVLIDDCVDPFNPETIRSSMGTSLKSNLHFLKSEQLKEFILRNHINLFIADMKADEPVNNDTDRRPLGLLLGSEANGFKGFPKDIYDSFKKICVKISIDTESLNVAVCGGILMNKLR